MTTKLNNDYTQRLYNTAMVAAPPLTFVLQSLNRSGGSRVTVEMGNHLIRRGYPVRIAVHKREGVAGQVKEGMRYLYLRSHRLDFHNWGRGFLGPIQRFHHLDDLSFAPGEIVIAVGTDAIDHVVRLSHPVTKIRYCHGFAEDRPEKTARVWQGPMPTIAVAQTLTARLATFGAPVIGVVHNGISLEEYYDHGDPRAWIGFMYSTHYNKAPEHIRDLVATLRNRWPAIRFHSFGQASRPSWLRPDEYIQYPTIPQARAVYNRSKIWLVLSRMEGLPGPVLEAMACGCAVVSTNNMGSCELIRDGENGLLLPIGDIDSFAKAVARLLSDTTLRERLVHNGRNTAHTYTWTSATDQMEQVLRGIIALPQMPSTERGPDEGM